MPRREALDLGRQATTRSESICAEARAVEIMIDLGDSEAEIGKMAALAQTWRRDIGLHGGPVQALEEAQFVASAGRGDNQRGIFAPGGNPSCSLSVAGLA